MKWCLGCHRDPGPHLHAAAEVFAGSLPATGDRHANRPMPAPALQILQTERRLTDCSTCHR
jgi:hypothetical protein